MAHINADRVKETTLTTGTGAITLAGAVVGFHSFLAAPMATNDTCDYSIVSATGVDWETGIGTFTAPSTLARTIFKSSSTGFPIAFAAGTKDVFIGPIAKTKIPWNPVTNTLDISVNALNDVAVTSPTTGQVLKYSGTEWTNQADAVNAGTVTSVALSGGTTGLSVTGSPITDSGTITLAGTLATANGGTGRTTIGTASQVLSVTSAGTALEYTTPTVGTVQSVSGTGTVSGLTLSGTVTSSGSLTLGGTLNAIPLATGVSGTLPLANGGTGQITAQAAMNSLAGGVTSAQYLRGTGTNVVMSAIQVGDVPTLNQNTTGTAATVTGATQAAITTAANLVSVGTLTSGVWNATTIAVANGGTGVTTSTGTGAVVLSNSPVLVTPSSNSLSAVAVGSGAGNSLTIAAGNGITSGAGGNLVLNPGEQATTGERGTVLIDGLNAGKGKGSGTNNTVFGAGSLSAITTGNNNVAIGASALVSNTVASYCIAIGYQTLFNNTYGENNVALGYQSLRANISGNSNLAIGYGSSISNALGSGNCGIGTFALYALNSGSYNTAIGFASLNDSTAGSYNTAIGASAGTSHTTGTGNTLIGYASGMGSGNGAATNSIVIGYNAVGKGSNTTVLGNTSTTETWLYGTVIASSLSAIPVTSGAGNSLTIAAGNGITSGAGGNLILNPGEQATTGVRGIVIIDTLNAGKGKGSGIDNTAFGSNALNLITTGPRNTAFGARALASIVSGEQNIAIGNDSLRLATTSINNIAVGSASFYKTTTGNNNIGIGTGALFENITSNNNTGIGFYSLFNAIAASNTAMGYQSGRSITTGSSNTFLGNNAGNNASQLSTAVNSMALGNDAFTTADNQVVIGNTSVTQTLLRGTVNATALSATPVTSGPGNSLTIAAGNGITSGAGGNLILQAGLQATSGGDGKVVVKQLAGQTSNIFEVQQQNGTAMISVTTANTINFNDGGGASMQIGLNKIDIMPANNSPVNVHTGTAAGLNVSNFASASLLCGGYAAASVPLIVRSHASQTANLQEWRNSAGTALANIDKNGWLHIGDNVTSYPFSLTNSGAIGMRVAVTGSTIGNPAFDFYDSTNGVEFIMGANGARFAMGSYSNHPLQLITGTIPRITISNAGNVLVNGFTAATKGLIIQAAASQTANLQEWQNSSGTALATVDAAGNITSNALSATPVTSGPGNSLTIAAGNGITSGAGGNLILQAGLQTITGGDGKVVVKQILGQTSNLQEWQDSAGNPKLTVDTNGAINLTPTSSSNNVNNVIFTHTNNYLYIQGGSNGVIIGGGGARNQQIILTTNFEVFLGGAYRFVVTNAGNVGIGINGTPINNLLSVTSPTTADSLATVLFAPTDTTKKGLVIQGKASQTANLQEWQNSAGTALAAVNSAGKVGIGTASPTSPMEIVGANGYLFKAAGTTANSDALFSVSDNISYNNQILFGYSTGAAMNNSGNPGGYLWCYNSDLYITAYGAFHTKFYTNNIERIRITSGGNFGIGLTVPSARTHIVTAAATKGLIVQGAASQTANLQEWQNSAGTALATVDAAGNFITAASYIKTPALTVAALPAAATAGAGARAFVSDASASTFASIVAGGGANGVPVYSNGTNWRIG